MKSKIVFFELNEVPLRIVEEFRARHPRSCLATKLASCRQYETFAEDQGHLSPWVTWPSLHRGVANGWHGIHSFGQDLADADAQFPTVWRLLAERGVRTGVFGSLHSYADRATAACANADGAAREQFAFYVPDTFAAGSECFPEQLSLFQEFNLSMVQDSPRNVSPRVRWGAALRMLARAPALGLKPKTLIDIGLQLCSERVRAARRVRRRTWQALLAFDVFFRQLSSARPDFATFFTNHVASAMHRYWAASHPQDYQHFGYDAAWVETYRDEIDFTLRQLDRRLARLVSFVDRHPEYQLWIATSMGQAATTAEPIETQLYAADLDRFLHVLGVPPLAWSRRPAMAPDVNVVIDEPYGETFERSLRELTIDGQPLLWQRGAKGFFNFRLGHFDLHRKATCARLAGRELSWPELGLTMVPIDDQASVTAYHVPQGLLLVYDPRQAAGAATRTQISTLDIAPALLRRFAVPVPTYMQTNKLLTAA